MDMYLTNSSSGDAMHFPLLPDKMKVSGGDANVIGMTMIGLGEIRMPRGMKVVTYSWDGVLPGTYLRDQTGATHWITAESIRKWIERCRDEGTKLRFMVTGIGVNDDVFIEKFTGVFAGGRGDYQYSITLTRWREVNVQSSTELGIRGDTVAKLISAHYAAARPASLLEQYITHTVVKGDTLYSIAKKYLGKGKKRVTLYKLNKEMLDAANKGRNVDKYTIYVGQVLLVKLKPSPPASSSGGSSNGGKKKTPYVAKNDRARYDLPQTATQARNRTQLARNRVRAYTV